MMDSAMLVIQRLEGHGESLLLADAWRSYAISAQKLGLTVKAQQGSHRAYEIYYSHGEYGKASLCLYERCIAYHSIGDTAHVAAILQDLHELTERDTSALTQYNYYAILFAYRMMEEDAPRAAEAGRKSIYYLQRIDHCKQYNIVPAWSYYDQALVYDLLYDPPLVDSIAYYLDLAEQAIAVETYEVDRQEIRISIGDERAWLCYYRGDYQAAEQQMYAVLALIDTISLSSPATIITERGEAYSFLVKIYEEQGRYDEALRYQQLLSENNKERYDLERQRVLDDVQTKYEVAQTELELERAQRRNMLMIGGLAISGLVILVVLAVLLAIWYRKRGVEEELYAKALEADNIYQAWQKEVVANDVEPMELIRRGLIDQVSRMPSKTAYKSEAIDRLQRLDLSLFLQMLRQGENLSTMDKRYLMCFAAGLSAEQVGELFSIEPASVYTVRYRIRKKFPSDKKFPW